MTGRIPNEVIELSDDSDVEIDVVGLDDDPPPTTVVEQESEPASLKPGPLDSEANNAAAIEKKKKRNKKKKQKKKGDIGSLDQPGPSGIDPSSLIPPFKPPPPPAPEFQWIRIFGMRFPSLLQKGEPMIPIIYAQEMFTEKDIMLDIAAHLKHIEVEVVLATPAEILLLRDNCDDPEVVSLVSVPMVPRSELELVMGQILTSSVPVRGESDIWNDDERIIVCHYNFSDFTTARDEQSPDIEVYMGAVKGWLFPSRIGLRSIKCLTCCQKFYPPDFTYHHHFNGVNNKLRTTRNWGANSNFWHRCLAPAGSSSKNRDHHMKYAQFVRASLPLLSQPITLEESDSDVPEREEDDIDRLLMAAIRKAEAEEAEKNKLKQKKKKKKKTKKVEATKPVTEASGPDSENEPENFERAEAVVPSYTEYYLHYEDGRREEAHIPCTCGKCPAMMKAASRPRERSIEDIAPYDYAPGVPVFKVDNAHYCKCCFVDEKYVRTFLKKREDAGLPTHLAEDELPYHQMSDSSTFAPTTTKLKPLKEYKIVTKGFPSGENWSEYMEKTSKMAETGKLASNELQAPAIVAYLKSQSNAIYESPAKSAFVPYSKEKKIVDEKPQLKPDDFEIEKPKVECTGWDLIKAEQELLKKLPDEVIFKMFGGNTENVVPQPTYPSKQPEVGKAFGGKSTAAPMNPLYPTVPPLNQFAVTPDQLKALLEMMGLETLPSMNDFLMQKQLKRKAEANVAAAAGATPNLVATLEQLSQLGLLPSANNVRLA
ncbi:unnamed protein product [Caenorhabditis auriculariae]|uniref:c-SKI SMAD4-binding domain-containing protein n=1 Tax=Caenorhabditis auriculariae TaxID=2777116 RepID=A0A8S1HX38_9PELO|nr:unnamed protein product [Caenorhabditis auriculariae]